MSSKEKTILKRLALVGEIENVTNSDSAWQEFFRLMEKEKPKADIKASMSIVTYEGDFIYALVRDSVYENIELFKIVTA